MSAGWIVAGCLYVSGFALLLREFRETWDDSDDRLISVAVSICWPLWSTFLVGAAIRRLRRDRHPLQKEKP